MFDSVRSRLDGWGARNGQGRFGFHPAGPLAATAGRSLAKMGGRHTQASTIRGEVLGSRLQFRRRAEGSTRNQSE